ncbi:N-acetylmuramoyl-L-alanine amidase [Paenibacillus sp. FSL K6-1330]|uniref:N-acetylmuramoyl-L-alanine amidase n=1 Tax=Paenibacillus sp. FSL K6-1330 TaxID=2975292 RepID=UPI0030DAECA6
MKKGATIIPLILSAIFIILLYNNLSNEGSASYRMADITSSNDRSHGKQTQHDPESTNMAAVLLEMCYLTNPQEEEEMLTEEVQYRIASSILDRIKEYLTLQ